MSDCLRKEKTVMKIADREDEEGTNDNSILSLTLCCSQINCIEIFDTADNVHLKHCNAIFPQERETNLNYLLYILTLV